MTTTTPKMRFHFRPRVWTQRVHLWASLIVGLVLIVVTTSGSIALFHHEVDQAMEPKYYRVTSGEPISFGEAWKVIKAAHPNEPVHDVIRANSNSPYYASVGTDYDKKVYVDPGTGLINGVKGRSETIMGWFAKLHYSLFLDTVKFTYPTWVPAWTQAWIGESLSDLVLKITALALGVMVFTGAVLWWPGIKKFAYGFKLRRNGSTYLRQYDWHKILGFTALPFLMMWALTAMNFYEPFHPLIEKAWLTATFSSVAAAPEDLKSDPTNKTASDQISLERLRAIAEREVPGGRVINLGVPDLKVKFKDKDAEAEARAQAVTVWLAKGIDPYHFSEYPGNYSVTVDQYSGKVLDTNRERLNGSLGANIFENWFYPIHAGIAVPWWARTLWFAFGMTPLFLAVTGIRMYLIKRHGRVERKRKAALHQPSPANADD
jgi:uncharacterized iron-regulated membrane protein